MTLICLALLPTLAFSQETPLTVGNAAWAGLIVGFRAAIEPAGAGPARLPGAVIPIPDGTHRIITDAAHKRRFGYDLHATLLSDGQTLRIALGPLTGDRPGRSFPIEAGWTLIEPPKFPVVPVMRAGDTAAIDLLINPATGQKVVEYLSVERADLDPARTARSAPRDFAPEDVELFLDRPRIWVNGALVEATADSSGGIRAHAIWFYLPHEGTFVLSLWPEPALGFQKAGMLQGRTMTFRSGALEYRVECASPIAPGSGLYNLYLYRDPAPRQDNQSQFRFGGADKTAWLVHK